MIDLLKALTDSPFFESFEQKSLEVIASRSEVTTVEAGTLILNEGAPADTLYMLLSGRVQLSFTKEPAKSAPGEEISGTQMFLRNITEPGRVLGWSAMVEPFEYRATALALEKSVLLAIGRDSLEEYTHENPEFGFALMKRVLWVLGNRLRETRIRLVVHRYENEIISIRTLLDQHAEQLSVQSPLHKLPVYLENRLTLADAFVTLELVKNHGEQVERNLAEICLDLLEDVRRELNVYQALQNVYEQVTHASHTSVPSEIRKRCCEAFIRLFEHTRYIIQGWEYLPDTTGHIFIINHLDNHPDSALPNDFRLTLDTHFVSSMILFKKYGVPPIRVIRKSHPDEYAHQSYYDRLGYIYVYSGHVDENLENQELHKEQRRRLFLDQARSYLLEKKNIVICPEGACTTTERSPLSFKPGAFRLANYVRPEPYIVPVAVANFDLKITHTTLVALIQKPFLLSEVVPDPIQDESLFAFMNKLEARFREAIQQAVELAKASISAQ